jgi:hypothetical protein
MAGIEDILHDSPYYRVIHETWLNGTKIVVHERNYDDEVWKVKFDLVANLNAEMDKAKAVIANNTKVLLDMGLLNLNLPEPE